jgi:hypothetical protein
MVWSRAPTSDWQRKRVRTESVPCLDSVLGLRSIVGPIPLQVVV